MACSLSMRFIISIMGQVRNGFDPNITFPEQVDQLFHRDSAVDRPFYDILAFIECNLTWSAAYIAEIGVCHFPGAVDDATHDSDLHAFQVVGHAPDLFRRFLEIEQGPATGGTGNVFGLANAGAGRL